MGEDLANDLGIRRLKRLGALVLAGALAVGLMGQMTSSRVPKLVEADDINDYQAFVTESLFYHLAYGYFHGRESKMSFPEVYERLRFSLYFLGIDNRRDSPTAPLLAADFPEDLPKK
jgi:hypothetical protein